MRRSVERWPVVGNVKHGNASVIPPPLPLRVTALPIYDLYASYKTYGFYSLYGS